MRDCLLHIQCLSLSSDAYPWHAIKSRLSLSSWIGSFTFIILKAAIKEHHKFQLRTHIFQSILYTEGRFVLKGAANREIYTTGKKIQEEKAFVTGIEVGEIEEVEEFQAGEG